MRTMRFRIRTLMYVVAATALVMGFFVLHVRFIFATQADAAPSIVMGEFVLLVTLAPLSFSLIRCVRAVRMERAYLSRTYNDATKSRRPRKAVPPDAGRSPAHTDHERHSSSARSRVPRVP